MLDTRHGGVRKVDLPIRNGLIIKGNKIRLVRYTGMEVIDEGGMQTVDNRKTIAKCENGNTVSISGSEVNIQSAICHRLSTILLLKEACQDAI